MQEDLFAHILPFGSDELRPPEQFPIVARLNQDGHALWLFGIEHTRTASHEQFAELRRHAMEFVALSGSRIFACEAVVPDVASSGDEAHTIEKLGERGFLAKVAHDLGTPIRSIEPSFSDIISVAVRHAPARTLAVWALLSSHAAQPGAEIATSVERIRRDFSLSESAETLSAQLSADAISWTGVDLSAPPDVVRAAIRADFRGTPVQQAAAVINQSRDFLIGSNLLDLVMSDGAHVFAVLGWNHVRSLLPAFRAAGYH